MAGGQHAHVHQYFGTIAVNGEYLPARIQHLDKTAGLRVRLSDLQFRRMGCQDYLLLRKKISHVSAA